MPGLWAFVPEFRQVERLPLPCKPLSVCQDFSTSSCLHPNPGKTALCAAGRLYTPGAFPGSGSGVRPPVPGAYELLGAGALSPCCPSTRAEVPGSQEVFTAYPPLCLPHTTRDDRQTRGYTQGSLPAGLTGFPFYREVLPCLGFPNTAQQWRVRFLVPGLLLLKSYVNSLGCVD